MAAFTISLADIPIQIIPLHEEVIPFFTDYLVESDPIINITIAAEDIEYERYRSELQSKKDKSIKKRSDLYLETLAILRKIANTLPDHDAFLFHGSAIVYQEKTYLFTAPSGTGKTTHIEKWLRLLPGSYVLNGDKPFIKVTEDQILVCGAPWRGKEKYGCNDIKPLEAICIIEQSNENRICPIPSEEAIAALLNQVYTPYYKTLKIVELIKQVMIRTRLYKLSCNMEDEAALLSIRTMVKDED